MVETSARASTGTIVTAFLAMAATYVTLASFEFVLVAMQLDLLFSTDSANSLAYMPAAASLMVVFIAGIFLLTQIQHAALERRTHYA
mgnify:CR=1 FL=1